ncbi:MAG TPA: hypothetical protein PLV85_22870, partial [Polyangiaceae bacterium]|nr:hypothetical protein [Polyangiaceae bacterium]
MLALCAVPWVVGCAGGESTDSPAGGSGGKGGSGGTGGSAGTGGSSASGGSGGSTDACVPITCEEKSAECGTISDGCGSTIDCGSCTAPETCGGG